MWSMYDQFCLQKPNVHNSTLLKNRIRQKRIQGMDQFQIELPLLKLRWILLSVIEEIIFNCAKVLNNFKSLLDHHT